MGRSTLRRRPKRRVSRRQRQRHQRQQHGGEHEVVEDYVFVNLVDASPELRSELTDHMRICWPESTDIEDTYNSDVSRNRRIHMLMYRKDEGAIVFARLLTMLPDEKALSIDLTCVSPTHRGKGYYKSSLSAMRKKFDPEEYKYIVNKADFDTIGDIDHSKRLLVFHKLGYRFNPVYQIGVNNYVPTQFKLKNGEIVQLLEFVEDAAASGASQEPSYTVLTKQLKPKVIKVSEIDRCILPQLIENKFIVEDGTSNGKMITKKPEEVWEYKNSGIQTKDELYPWSKIKRRFTAPIEGNRFNASLFEDVYCPLIMPF